MPFHFDKPTIPDYSYLNQAPTYLAEIANLRAHRLTMDALRIVSNWNWNHRREQTISDPVRVTSELRALVDAELAAGTWPPEIPQIVAKQYTSR